MLITVADQAAAACAQGAAAHDHQHEDVDRKFLGIGELAVGQVAHAYVCKRDHGDHDADNDLYSRLDIAEDVHDLLVNLHFISPFGCVCGERIKRVRSILSHALGKEQAYACSLVFIIPPAGPSPFSTRQCAGERPGFWSYQGYFRFYNFLSHASSLSSPSKERNIAERIVQKRQIAK